MNESNDSESTIFYALRLIFSNWKLLMGLYFTVGLVTVIILLVIPKWYKSDATIVILEESNSSLSSILSDFSAFGLGVGSSVNVETYIQYLRTKKMYDRLIQEFNLMEVYEAPTREDAYELIFQNLMVNDNENNTFTISYVYKEDPVKAKQIVEFLFDELEAIVLEVEQAQARSFRTYIESYYQDTQEQLRRNEDSLTLFQEQTGVLSFEDQLSATVSSIAELELQLVKLEIEKRYLTESFTDNQRIKDLDYQISAIQDKIQSMKAQQNSVILSLDNVPEQGKQYYRLRRDISIGTQVTEFLRLQYEQALLDEQKIESNLYLVDPPQIAEKKYKPQRMKSLFVVMFFTVLLSLIYIRLKDFYSEHQSRIHNLLS